MTLNDNLIAYWKLDETSGNRADSHTGGHTLVDNNTVTSGTGKVVNAAQFTAANSEKLTLADNASISLGADTAFTWAFWVNLDTKTGRRTFVNKYDGTGNIEYIVEYNNATDRFRGFIGTAGSSTTVTANNFGSPSTGAWHFLCFQHDPTANTIGISVNNGTFNTAAWASGTIDTAHPLILGVRHDTDFMDGRIDEVGFWHRVLAADEITRLYNSGSGITYPFGVSAALSSSGPGMGFGFGFGF